MKKFLALIMCGVMALGMVACGGSNETPNTDNVVESNVPESSVVENEVVESVEEQPEVDVLKEAAMGYFADFADDKNIISPAKLFEKINNGEEMVIIDIRQADAYAEAHLKGAVNIPYGTVAEALELIPDDVPVYVNCYSGQTSSQTTALLRIAGKYATNISGGYSSISATEGYDAVCETEVHTLTDASYEVDDAIEAAIADYYTAATTGTYASFHFPVASVKELVDVESDAYTILSVRAAADYEAGHIAGAMNIPFGKGMQESFDQIPTDKPVIVYCYSGQTASQVLGVLRMLGFEAYNMPGGMGKEGGSGWLGAGNPVVTE